MLVRWAVRQVTTLVRWAVRQVPVRWIGGLLDRYYNVTQVM